MKKLLIVLVMTFLAGCSGGVSTEIDNTSNIEKTSTQETIIQYLVENKDDENVVVLDVRSKEERDVEYAIDSIHLDVEDIKLGETPEASKDAEIYVYCRSGNRAGQAISILKQNGFENLVNIGGLSDWKRFGGETNLTCEDC